MRILNVMFSVAVLAGAMVGQSTGCPLVSDYTINGSGSGSTSCNLITIPTGSPIDFEVQCLPGSTVIFLWSLCPCTPGSAWFPPCGCSVNSLDLDLVCGVFQLQPIQVGGSGLATITVPFCAPGTFFSTQAVVLDPFCPPGTFRLTQAYDVLCL